MKNAQRKKRKQNKEKFSRVYYYIYIRFFPSAIRPPANTPAQCPVRVIKNKLSLERNLNLLRGRTPI